MKISLVGCSNEGRTVGDGPVARVTYLPRSSSVRPSVRSLLCLVGRERRPVGIILLIVLESNSGERSMRVAMSLRRARDAVALLVRVFRYIRRCFLLSPAGAFFPASGAADR